MLWEHELEWSAHKSAPHSVCVCVRACVCLGAWRRVCAFFTLAYACVILFNYRSGFEAEANSAIITGNTSFNILWKSTPHSTPVRVCVCVWGVLYIVFILHERRNRRWRSVRGMYMECLSWMAASSSLMSSCPLLIPPLLFTISHFRFVFPNGFAKRLFFPTFELLASQIFMLPFTGPRDRGVKKEERDLDASIKDEQHLKCIKRADEHCSGMARCKA